MTVLSLFSHCTHIKMMIFVSKIVTSDRTWVSHNMLESKQQSMQWRHGRSPKKSEIQANNLYPEDRAWLCALFFWTVRNKILPQNKTINTGQEFFKVILKWDFDDTRPQQLIISFGGASLYKESIQKLVYTKIIYRGSPTMTFIHVHMGFVMEFG